MWLVDKQQDERPTISVGLAVQQGISAKREIKFHFQKKKNLGSISTSVLFALLSYWCLLCDW